jgi:glycine/D-amino acid oxidase-like deaminating enzyme
MEVDFIIVGHGIAGINIAHQLEQHKQSYVLFNEDSALTSSKIAAGLYNPVTGRKMKHTWMAQELFPFLQHTYQELENTLNIKCLHEQSIYRPFKNIEEQNEWLSNKVSEDIFIKEIYTSTQFPETIHDDFGGIMLQNSGFLDLKSLIESHKSYLIEKQLYFEEQFNTEEVIHHPKKIIYRNISAKKLIFCDGPLAKNNFFNWVPTAAVKGEILHIIPDKPLASGIIFNRGVFMVKNPAHAYYRVGSTYHWKDLDWQTTEEAKDQLIERLKALLKVDFTIVGQEAGIRPASKDRRPLIGQHPEKINIFLFNGLGTKGVSLAPYFSKNLIEHIILGLKIDDAVNINRYYSLY